VFDGIKIRRIRRQKEEFAAHTFNQLADFQAFMKGGVVDHDCLAWPKLWHKHVLDVNFENGFRAKSLKTLT
jgi:succinylglutamate desuccinylase